MVVQPATIENWAAVPLADPKSKAPANAVAKPKEIAPQDLSWAMLPVPALPPASAATSGTAPASPKQSSGESADAFLRRAEQALYSPTNIQPSAELARATGKAPAATTQPQPTFPRSSPREPCTPAKWKATLNGHSMHRMQPSPQRRWLWRPWQARQSLK